MYALAEKFKDVTVFLIQTAGDQVSHYEGYSSADEAWEDEKGFDWVKEAVYHGKTLEECESEFLNSFKKYSADELLQVAKDGYGWPIDMGFVNQQSI